MSMRSGSQGLRQVSAAGSVVFAVCLALAPGLGRAALKTKAGTGTDLTAVGSWDALPGSGDVAAWANTSLCAGLTLPGNMSWSGLLVAGALTDIDITGAGTLTSGASGIDLSASAVNLSLGTPVALAANQTWSVTNNRTLAVSGSVGGAFGLTKAGGGTVALTGSNNTWTGSTVVNAGTLNLSGGFGGAIGTIGSSVLGVGFANGTTGAVAVIGGGTFAATKLMVGYTGGSGNTTQGNGWLIVTNGTINVTNTANYFVIGGEEANPANGTQGVGQVDLSGSGTISFSPKTVSDIEMGTRGGRGVLNVGGNSTLTGNHLQLGLGSGPASTNARVYVTQSGGTVALSDANGLYFMNVFSGALTVYNLNGGVLRTKAVTHGNNTVGAIFNFNGGTLEASVNTTNFMGGLNSAIIYAGGATLSDGGFAITNSQALAAPTLYGLGPIGTTLAPTAAGTGYTTPPNVTFSTPSGGVPATGCAELNADGTIKDIVITSPGSGYASGQPVTITLVGGGGGSGATFAGLTASVASIGGGLTKTGNGTLTLSGANTYTGGTTNSAGVLRLGLATALPVGRTLTVNGGTVDMQNYNVAIGSLSGTGGSIAVGGQLVVTQSADAAYGGVIAGAGVLSKAGTASLTLSGTNAYSGGTTISEGTLTVNNSAALGTGLLTMSGGTLSNSVSCTLANAVNLSSASTVGVSSGTMLTLGGMITNTGTLTKVGDGTLTLCASNTYSGYIVINGGTLRLQSFPAAVREWNADSLTGANGSLVSNWTDTVACKNATVDNAAPTLSLSAINGHNAITFNGSSQDLKVLASDSSVSGAGAFTVAAVFKPAASGANGVNWYGNSGLVDAEQYGVTNDWGLAWNSANQLAAGIGNPDHTLNSAAASLNTPHVVIYGWNAGSATQTLSVDGVTTTLAGSGTAARSASQILFGRLNNTYQYFNGQIADIQFFNAALTDTDINNLGYSLAHTYGIATAYTNNGAVLLGTAAVSIAAGGTLDLNGMRQTVSRLQGGGTVSNGTLTVTGTLAPGGTDAVGTLAVTDFVMAENSIYDWNYNDATSDSVRVTGTLTLPAVATMAVSRVTGSVAALPYEGVLFSCASVVLDAGTLNGWVMTGARPGTQVKIRNNQVVFVSPRGTMIKVW